MLRRTLSAAISVLLPTCVLAQAPVIPSPKTAAPALPAPTAPGAAPVPVAPAAPASASAAPLPGLEPTYSLQIPASADSVKDVLAMYESLTGKRLILDAQVTGSVPLNINTKVTKEEAIKIIEVALLMNQFSIVPTEDKTIWKVIGVGKNTRSYGVPIYTDEAMLPETEQIVSFLFKLKYADPQELQQTLQTAFPANPVLGGQSMTSLPKAGALLVTENTAIIRQIIRIVNQLDTPPARIESRFFVLQRADAKDIQDKLTDILTKKDAAPSGAVVQGQNPQGGQPGQPGRQPGVARVPTTPEGLPLPEGASGEGAATTVELNIGPNEENIIAGKIKITADIRTNRIHIVTRPENMRFVADLIEEFDANVPFGEPSVYTLKHVNARDVFDVVIRAASDPGAQNQAAGLGGQPGTGQRPPGSASTGNTPFGSNRNNQSGLFGQNGFGGGSSGFGSGGGGGTTLSETVTMQEKPTEPQATSIGNTRIIADNRANSIIVVGSRDVKEKLFAVIKQLDVRSPQVMIHTCIGQLTLSENEQFGVNYIINLGRDLNNFAGGTTVGGGTGNGNGQTVGNGAVAFNGTNPVLNFANLLGQEQIKQIAVAGATGFSGYFTAGNAFDALVTALESTNKFRVVSRPIIQTTNNKPALISSGEEIAIPGTIQSGFNSGNLNNNNLVTNTNVQYRDVALTLQVLPLINSDREVSLDIQQKIQEQSGTTRIDNNDIPRISSRLLQTNVTVPNNATLVLGGLIKQRNNKSYTGIPIISRIPLIGPLFRSTTYDRSREELIILIKPVVTFAPGESVRASDREQEILHLEPDLEETLFEPMQRERAEAPLKATPPLLRDSEQPTKVIKPAKSAKPVLPAKPVAKSVRSTTK